MPCTGKEKSKGWDSDGAGVGFSGNQKDLRGLLG